MLLQKQDTKPNVVETKYRLTRLSWAVGGGDMGVVKVFGEWKDVRTETPDEKSQTPLALALSKGHGGFTRILLEPGSGPRSSK